MTLSEGTSFHIYYMRGCQLDRRVVQSAIARGTITTTKEDVDLTGINRDTANALNQLGKIFDKKKLEERQELSRLFMKNADELFHYYDRDGKLDKVGFHAAVIGGATNALPGL